jgi:CHAT domain
MGWRNRLLHALAGAQNTEADNEEGLSADEQARWAVGADGWWGSRDDSAADLLRRMSQLSPSRAEVIPFRHPRLLAATTVHSLQAQPGVDAGTLEQVTRYSQAAYTDSLEWPVGLGPIESLWQRVTRNMLSLDEALMEAAAIGRRGDLIAPYARALARWTVQQAMEQQPDASLQIARLTLAAAEAAEPGAAADGWPAWRWAADAFTEVAKASLVWKPDDALYVSTRALLERIIAWGKGNGPRQYGLALSLLGRFLLDPYTADKPAERYEEALELWQSRRRPNYDAPQAPPMPEPVDALRESADALREAAGLLDRGAAAVVWKALVQALHTLSIIDPDAAVRGAGDADVVAVAISALERIDPVTHGDLIPFVQLVLDDHEKRLARSGPVASPTALEHEQTALQSEESLDALAERAGRRQAITTGMWRFNQALEDDPARAAVILSETWRLAADHGDQELRREVLHAHLTLLVRELPSQLRIPAPLADRVRQLDSALASADPVAVGGALLGLAANSGATNEELLGLNLLNRALELDPDIPQRMPMQFSYLLALLRFGHACNLGQAKQLADAIEAYGSAADTFIDCGVPDMARQCIQRIGGDASADASTAIAAVLGLGRSGLKFARSLDRDTNALIAQILRTSSAELTTPPVPPALPVLRDELAKGLMLGAAIASPAAVALDERGHQLLREIAVLDAQAATDGLTAGVGASALDDEDMLVSYVAQSEATPGRNAAEVAINLKRTFDDHFATELYGRPGSAAWLTVDQLKSSLDDHTLLVSVFLGAVPDGRLAVHVQALTNVAHDLSVIPLEFPSSLVQLEHSGVNLTQSPLGLPVANLRRRIQEDPLFDAVDREAGQTLAHWLPMFFGPFAARLAEWHTAGLDHLVVWPQGPLHYLPWHLFDCPATLRPVADDWTVTVVPSVACLTRPPGAPGTGLVAVGCADAGRPYGLPSVPSMPQQAQAIAQAFGVAPLAAPAATPGELLRRVKGARYLHLATHGSHQEEAPAFQCIYLTPDGSNGEGRLFAYEIAGADLRGIELVTLSACESALGRFDLGDNLRGLPAAFLAAGASAVVGALWEVSPAPATSFFTTLYSQLAAQADKLAAYRAAQIATRKNHPEYRDWGAFCYVGDWR